MNAIGQGQGPKGLEKKKKKDGKNDASVTIKTTISQNSRKTNFFKKTKDCNESILQSRKEPRTMRKVQVREDMRGNNSKNSTEKKLRLRDD